MSAENVTIAKNSKIEEISKRLDPDLLQCKNCGNYCFKDKCAVLIFESNKTDVYCNDCIPCISNGRFLVEIAKVVVSNGKVIKDRFGERTGQNYWGHRSPKRSLCIM